MVEAGRETSTVVIALKGDLSVQTLASLREVLAHAEACDVVILDLREVDYVDSTTLTAFVKLRSSMLGGGRAGTVRIAAPTNNVRRIFEICHLDKLFEVYDTLEEAHATS
jgi:anti-sigma B factor antagonist